MRRAGVFSFGRHATSGVRPPALIASACAIAGGPPEVAGYETAETIE